MCTILKKDENSLKADFLSLCCSFTSYITTLKAIFELFTAAVVQWPEKQLLNYYGDGVLVALTDNFFFNILSILLTLLTLLLHRSQALLLLIFFWGGFSKTHKKRPDGHESRLVEALFETSCDWLKLYLKRVVIG